VFERFRRLAFGMLTADDRRTITTLLEATGKAQCDWSADYRVFSRDVWEPADVFASLVPSILTAHPAGQAIVASLDDTNLHKSGTKIPGVAYRRDPMSPPFRPNFIRAQRFVQTSMAVPFASGPSASRAIPVGFDHAPSVGKLHKDASEDEKRLHREEEKQHSLTTYANVAINRLRETLDASSASERRLLLAVDGSYTNQRVLRHLPQRTDLIGRIRKDAVLHHPPSASDKKGRPRSYGTELTPEQVRQDESIPWKTIKVFGAGRVHDCDIKEVSPLLWRKTGPGLPLRLIIIRPLAYRRSKNSRLLYRQPAYLITTDVHSSVDELVQAYFWRWDIEVNHRDEKQLIGVGHAQVRSPKSAERVPAFAVACYSMLLISAAKAFGVAAAEPVVDRPKWLTGSSRKPLRLSTQQLLKRLKAERPGTPLNLPNFEHFASSVARSMKLPKSAVSLDRALQHALH
jgi:DDE superfamily endonuclease